MDVRLPNGKILRNVPEGTSRREVMEKAISARLAFAGDFLGGPVDVLGERKKAVGEFLSPIEKFGGGIRNITSRAASRINETLGLDGTVFGPPAEEVERNIREMSPGGFAEGAGEMAALLPTMRLGGRSLVGNTAVGAGLGALTAEDASMGAGIGGAASALGSGLGRLGGRMVNAVQGKWGERAVKGADEASDYIRRFQGLGGRLTPGQASGGKAMEMIDNAMTSNPLTAGPYRSIADQNQGLLTRLAAKAVGVNTDNLGPRALQSADDFISKQFNDVADQLDAVPIPEGLGDDITGLLQNRSREIRPFLDEMGSGNLSGRTYMSLRSKLLDITRGNSDKVDDAWTAINAMDDAVEDVAPEGFKQAYSAARERYKSLLSLDRYNRALSEGQANPKTLENAVRRVFGKQYTRDRGTLLPETQEFFDAVRAMSYPRMSPKTGGSPTAERMMPWMIGAGVPLSPGLAGFAGTTWFGARAALAAPASTGAVKTGAGLGRLAQHLAQKPTED